MTRDGENTRHGEASGAAPSPRDRAIGAMLGTFVGDALGMPYEGAFSFEIPRHPEMVDARRGRGTYTDDTEMTIALAESILAEAAIVPERLAEHFLRGCDPSRGYGAGTLAVFRLWSRGVSVGDAAGQVFDGEGSFGSGAAMRIAPVAVRRCDTLESLRRDAELSARVTHAHPIAIDGAVVQASAITAALRGEAIVGAALEAASTEELRRGLDFVRRLRHGPAPSPTEAARLLGNSSAAHKSVPLAIYSAASGDDFDSCVSYAVRCGGDADTIAAMAGAIAGARFGARNIPNRWLDALERGPRGREHVEGLAVRLAEEAAS
jgi:poly(ADP-ribose) glycohydrolase ARH3